MGTINSKLLYKDQEYHPSNQLSDSAMFEFPTGDGALWGQVMARMEVLAAHVPV